MSACKGWALAEALLRPSGGSDHFSPVLLPSVVLCVPQDSSSFTLDSSSHHHSPTKTVCWSLMCSGCPAISRRPCRVMEPRLCRSPVNWRVIKWDRSKTPLAHKAAGVTIDLGSDLLCFFLSGPLWTQFPLSGLSSMMLCCFQLLFSDTAPPLTPLLTWPSLSSSPHPPPPLLSLFSNFLRFGGIISPLSLSLCCFIKEPISPFKEPIWHKGIWVIGKEIIIEKKKSNNYQTH